MLRFTAKSFAALVAVAAVAAAGPGQASVWTVTNIPWLTVPAGKPIGPLPQTIPIPSKAWEYGARSDRIDALGKTQPMIVRVDLKVRSGVVGVALVSVDGSTLQSKEAPIKAEDGEVQLYFRVRPSSPPGFVILRNYDAEGQAGAVTVQQVQAVQEADLTNDELTAIVKRGLH